MSYSVFGSTQENSVAGEGLVEVEQEQDFKTTGTGIEVHALHCFLCLKIHVGIFH